MEFFWLHSQCMKVLHQLQNTAISRMSSALATFVSFWNGWQPTEFSLTCLCAAKHQLCSSQQVLMGLSDVLYIGSVYRGSRIWECYSLAKASQCDHVNYFMADQHCEKLVRFSSRLNIMTRTTKFGEYSAGRKNLGSFNEAWYGKDRCINVEEVRDGVWRRMVFVLPKEWTTGYTSYLDKLTQSTSSEAA